MDIQSIIQELANSKDPEQRRRAARQLRDYPGVESLESLKNALNDSDALVREESVRALGRMNDSRALEALIFALSDQSAWVRS
ncbi:MAG: HEAT repeat domain-containing protein, partial [Candidatus Obscuribacterales bacterium]|nr:HEAT repeat domain-containing protein [Candidatus Obscuribacterales bacterium]